MKVFAKITLTLALVLSMLFPTVSFTVSAAEIVTTATGYTSASDVEYVKTGNYIHNWGARGEDATFLTTKAASYYTTDISYTALSTNKGGTGKNDAPSSALYSSLQSMMKSKHTTETSYSATRDMYKYTDCVLSDSSKLSCFYSGKMVDSDWDGGKTYNREHTWPNSKGLEGNDENDIMMLRPEQPNVNSGRGNTAYGLSSNYFDPGESVHGDVARIMLYTYVRWGNTKYAWGTDGVMESVEVLLKWMQEDPVDTWELGRNDAVQSITGVRNVFIDYPEYAFLLFGKKVPTTMQTPSGIAKNGTAGGDGLPEVDDPDIEGDITDEEYNAIAAKDTLTVSEVKIVADKLAHDTTTTKKYYITAQVADVTDVNYGNMYIKDEQGGNLLVYGAWNSDGTLKYGEMTEKPDEGDTVKFYSVVSNYNGPQLKDAWITEWTEGKLESGGTPEYDDNTMRALFDFGEKGAATHVDGSNVSSGKKYTVGDYTLTLDEATGVYAGAFDAQGNSCLKIGTGKAAGSFSFTVPQDVDKVVINVAQYKANPSEVSVNGVSYEITTSSNAGEYTAIVVDTSSSKTVTVKTVSGKTRIMIDSISYHGEAKGEVGGNGGGDSSSTDSSSSSSSIGGGNSSGECVHEYGEWIVYQEPTTATTGLKVKACRLCGHKISEAIPAKSAGCSSSVNGSVFALGFVLIGVVALFKKKSK